MRSLLISLGGGRYPSAPNLVHAAFGPSSRAIADALSATDRAMVEANDHLNLFDDNRAWPEQFIEARNWIRSLVHAGRKETAVPPENIIVHYVGHGWFLPNSKDYLLTINHTDAEEKAATSAALGELNRMLLREAHALRRLYLIDACFAAAATRDFMVGDDDEAVERELGVVIGAWPEDERGKHGVAALCSADQETLASAGGDRGLTQFTDGLLTVLEHGDPNSLARISLRSVYQLLRRALQSKYGEDMVHPVLVAPSDRGGGIAGVPLFRNAHAERTPPRDAAESFSTFFDSVREVFAEKPDPLDGPPSEQDIATTEVLPTRKEHGEEPVLTSSANISNENEIAQKGESELETALSEDVSFRQIVYRFFRLPPSKMNSIVAEMKLRQAKDARMSELDRFKAALARVQREGQVEKLEELIGKAEEMR